MILDKIKLYKNKESIIDSNIIENFIQKQIFDEYEVMLPKKVIKELN